MLSDKEVMQKGMLLLEEHLGNLDTTRFISAIMQEGRNAPKDYVQWRNDFFDKMSDDEFLADLNEFIKNHKD